MYQVWLFIAPGLYANEKQFAIPFVLFSTLGFLGGAAFNHYVAFPFMMTFFASFNTPDLVFMPQLSDVFGLYMKMLLGAGRDLPDADGRVLPGEDEAGHGALPRRSSSSIAVLLIFIIAAVVTPTGDPMTQMIFAAR